jgi:hypothetical protein
MDLLGEALRADFSPASNIVDMDRQDVDVAALLPTLGCYALWADHIGPDRFPAAQGRGAAAPAGSTRG